MEDQKFDALVARLASGLTRRGAISALAAAGAAQLFESAEARKKKKNVKICRNGQTLSVTKKKKRKHLKPGDTAGPCPAPGTTSRPTTTSRPPRCQASAPNFCARLDFCVDACPGGKVFDPDSCACVCPAVATCCSCTRGSEFLCFQGVANAVACETACSDAGGTGATFAGGNGGSAVCDFVNDTCRVTCEPEAMACSCSAGKSCCEDVLGGCCPIDTPFCCPLVCCPATAPRCCKFNCCPKDATCCSSTDDCSAGEVCQGDNLALGGCCAPAP